MVVQNYDRFFNFMNQLVNLKLYEPMAYEPVSVFAATMIFSCLLVFIITSKLWFGLSSWLAMFQADKKKNKEAVVGYAFSFHNS